MQARKYLQLLRPEQWVKNLFIFLPIFFGHQIQQVWSNINLGVTFICFALVASSVYILNDWRDKDRDKRHPRKSKRPLASGDVSEKSALVLMLFLLGIALFVAFSIEPTFALILFAYFSMNVAYTFWLKRISILDISIIAIGFLLRVLAGGVVSGVVLSKWLVLMTFLLSMCLAIGKRRDDLLLQDNDLRPSLKGYTIEYINLSMVVMLVITIVCYIMYCVSAETIQQMGTENVYLTSFFVVLGVLRYLQITIVEEKSGSPTEIFLKDRFLQATLLAWVGSFVVLIYLLQ